MRRRGSCRRRCAASVSVGEVARQRVSGFGPLCAFAIVRKCAGPRPVRKQGGGRGAVGAQAALALAARGFPAMLGLRSHRETRCTHCVRCARTLAVSQITKRAGTRADLSPVLLGGAIRPACAPPAALRGEPFLGKSEGQAAGIEPVACRAPQARVQAPAGLDARLGSFSNQEPRLPRKAVGGCALARLCGGEEASPDTNSPVDCSCLASGWALAPSAACKARVSVGARTRALRQLTRRICSSAANAVSAASYAARPKPEHRSAVGAAGADRRTEAPARTRPRLCDPHGVCAKRAFKVGNGPTADLPPQ